VDDEDAAGARWRLVGAGAWGITRQAAADPAGARAAVAAGAIEALLAVVTRIQTAVEAEVAAAAHLGSLAPVAAAAAAKKKKITRNGQLKSKENADADAAALDDATAAVLTAEREYTNAAEVATEAARAAEHAARALQNLSTTAAHQVLIAKVGRCRLTR